AAVTHAKFVSFRVGHDLPRGRELRHRTAFYPVGAEGLETLHFCFDVVDLDVQVHTVLDRLGLRYPLQEQFWTGRLGRNEHDVGTRAADDGVAQCRCPELGQFIRVDTVQNETDTGHGRILTQLVTA